MVSSTSEAQSPDAQLSQSPISNLSSLLKSTRNARSLATLAANQRPLDSRAPASLTVNFKPDLIPVSRVLPVAVDSDVELSTRTIVATTKAVKPLNRIIGTPGADDITGTVELADFIDGRQGNDIMRGDNGNDYLIGGNGDDIISGDHVPSRTTESNDFINGQTGNDELYGRIGNDIIKGGEGNDKLFGGSGEDRLFGSAGDDLIFGGIVEGDRSFNPFPDGKDFLTGGAGNDFLDGGAGDDTVNGTSYLSKGAGEVDLLTGGQGRDTFVLGDRRNAYYTQGGANQDFAIILDFEVGIDRIRLHGSASDYVLGYDSTENATALSYLGGGGYEFVGVFADQDISGLSLDSSSFRYA